MPFTVVMFCASATSGRVNSKHSASADALVTRRLNFLAGAFLDGEGGVAPLRECGAGLASGFVGRTSVNGESVNSLRGQRTEAIIYEPMSRHARQSAE